MDGAQAVENILEHFGVKGMRWGVRRKATVGPREVIVRDTRRKIKVTGGEGHPASPDAVRARSLGRIGKKSGLKALSDQQLSEYSKRLQLEASVKRLEYGEKNAAQKFVAGILGKKGSQSPEDSGAETRRRVARAIKASAAAAAA